ncbi:MAG TPA: hypothetical protein VFY93_15660, partial [Planctomycetota bacterium]|nr:hypothetical protein [Planctomycetota bacterium]
AARAEARRPRRGVPLRQALSAALATLFPDRGRAFKEQVGKTVTHLWKRGREQANVGWQAISRRRAVPSGPKGRVLVRGTPPPTVRVPTRPRLSPRRMFVLLCVFAGCVLGLLGTWMRGDEEPLRAQTAPVETAKVAEPEPAAPPKAAPAPPNDSSPAAAPAAKPAPEPAQEIPSTTRELSPEDVRIVMKRLTGGRPQERDEAERFLIWHRAETAAIVRSALNVEQEPDLLAALEYVAASIEEEERTRDDVPTVVSSPPQRGLVLFTPSLDAAEEIAMVRRTGRAERVEVTIVFQGDGDAAAVAKSYGRELGDVRLYIDKDGALAKKLRLERTPAVVGLRGDGKAAAITYGRVQRSRLAEVAGKLRGR